MSDVYEHNPDDHEDPIPSATWLVGFIGAVLLTVIFLGIVSIFRGAVADTVQTNVLDVEPLDLQRLEARQLQRIDGEPRWMVRRAVDENGVEGPETSRRLVIPIDEAMRLVASDLGRQTPPE